MSQFDEHCSIHIYTVVPPFYGTKQSSLEIFSRGKFFLYENAFDAYSVT